MESECACPTCLKAFTTATATATATRLPCGHVFCAQCVAMAESRAASTSRPPACPACTAAFAPASGSQPHHTSVYHERLLTRNNPGKPSLCQDCDENPSEFFCQDGCGPLCPDCHELHAKHRKKSAHNVTNLKDKPGAVQATNTRECVFHKLPIVSICQQCWPAAEQCLQCERDDLKQNPAHVHIDTKDIEYTSINEETLIQKMSDRVLVYEKKKAQASFALEKLAMEEQSDFARIQEIYENLLSKAEELKGSLTNLVKTTFERRAAMIQYEHEEADASHHLSNHSISLIQESKQIHQQEKVVGKLFKTKLYCEKILSHHADIVSDPDESSVSPLPMNYEILITPKDVRLVQRPYKDIEDELEKCKNEIEQLRGSYSLPSAETKAMTERDQASTNQLAKQSINAKDYTYHSKVGTQGSGNLQFNNPWGIAVHPKTGHLYVTDDNHRVQVLDQDLKFIRTFGSNGGNPGQFKDPLGIAISQDGLVAVSEFNGCRIQVFDENDRVVATIQTAQKKSHKCEQAHAYDGLLKPWFVCFDDDGSLFVANNGRHRIDKFNKQFEFECSFGHSTAGDAAMPNPVAVMFNSKKELCVASWCGDRIAYFNSNGGFLKSITIKKLGQWVSLAEGPNNTIFVSDNGNSRIVAYDQDSGEEIHMLGETSYGSRDGQLNYQTGLAFGLNQKLYVCDKTNHRIQVFSA